MTEPLPTGQYVISPSFLRQPNLGVGADPAPEDTGAGSPVVFNGEKQVWFVARQPNGTYTLYLEDGGWAILDDNNDLWVNGSVGSGVEWDITRRPNSDLYLIMLPGGGLLWTLPNAGDKTRVLLQPGEEPYRFQEWVFRPVEE